MPSQEARKNIAIDAILQRLVPRAPREWACGEFYSQHYSQGRAGAGSVMPATRPSRRRIMHTICRLAGIIVATAITSAAIDTYAQETKQLPVPNVTVTAPAAPVEPPYLRNPWKSYERNPYAGRYRVEEDKFTEVPCNVTRIASAAGGRCLQGYRLVPGAELFAQRGGLKCDMALDVVMYNVSNLSIEASTLIFDPYKLVATGFPGKYCYVNSHPSYGQEDFQDMNQVTRRAINWRNLVSNGEDKSIEFS